MKPLDFTRSPSAFKKAIKVLKKKLQFTSDTELAAYLSIPASTFRVRIKKPTPEFIDRVETEIYAIYNSLDEEKNALGLFLEDSLYS